MTRTVPPVQIDFLRPAVRPPVFGRVVLVVGLVLLGVAYAEYAAVEGDLAEWRAQLERTQRALERSAASRQETPEAVEARKAADRVLRALNAPWGTFLSGIEAAAHDDVALLSLQADPGSAAVRVSGEARNFAAMTAYVRRLEAAPVLTEVRLSGHEVRQQDPRRPVAFALTAKWAEAR
jgi:Tfp pilus assembly protein PilN